LTPKHDYAATVKAIVEVVSYLERQAKSVRGTASVGVGIPGTVVQATGLVKNANSTWLNGQPLERDLTAALGRPVRCANDANCMAVSEATDGAAAGAAMVFGVILGTGCGGGVAVGGHVHIGPNGLAGEWGHNPLPWATEDELPGPHCYCGRFGCIETWISGTGLANDHATVHPPGAGHRLTATEIVAAAEAGDAAAEGSLVRLENRIGRALASAVNLLDPDVIVLGGGLSKADRLYRNLPGLIAGHLFGGGELATPVLKAMHGDASGVRGAAWLWPA
jgi:fructokinase